MDTIDVLIVLIGLSLSHAAAYHLGKAQAFREAHRLAEGIVKQKINDLINQHKPRS